MAESRMEIEVKTLTTCKVERDGETLELSFIGADGQPASLRLPFESAQAIAMTLPGLLTEAVQRITGEEQSRYVFPLGTWRLDAADDVGGAIATFATTDGFAVSFGIPLEACRSLGWALKSCRPGRSLLPMTRQVAGPAFIRSAEFEAWSRAHERNRRSAQGQRFAGPGGGDMRSTTIQRNDHHRSRRHPMAQAQTISQTIPFTRHPYADGGFKKMLIDGQWVAAASGKTFESRNPATGELLATVAEGDAEDINRAVAAARRAFEGPWSKVKPFERQAILLRLADLVEKNFEELSQLDTLDMGAPLMRTRATKQRVLGMLRYYAGKATSIVGETIENSLPGDIFSYTLKEPVGVVGAIIPWNGPLGASVWKIGPALATGCTVVLKPAEEAPLTSLRLGELCMEAGVPPGVVNVVPGYGETAGAALASHPGVDKVAFTGSHVTGQSIVRASAGNLKRRYPRSSFLGGKSPDVAFADADLDAAVPGAAMAVFANSGQICSAGTRLFVESRVYDEFVGKVAEFGKKLRVGNGLDPETQIGPLVSEQQLERVTAHLGGRRSRRARPRSRAARARPRARASPKATSCRRPCSPTSTTTCASPRRRFLAR